jgi:hypothetical protein
MVVQPAKKIMEIVKDHSLIPYLKKLRTVFAIINLICQKFSETGWVTDINPKYAYNVRL